MKISTRGRYGLGALLDLAVHSSEGHASLKSISERCAISEAYILQIFIILRKADIVKSIRGAQGGYVLARDPSDISVGDVLRPLEGSFAPVDCIAEGAGKPCGRFACCATRVLWEKITTALDCIADSITIADLVESYNNSFSKKAPNAEYII